MSSLTVSSLHCDAPCEDALHLVHLLLCHIFPFLNYWFNCYSKGSSMTWKSLPGALRLRFRRAAWRIFFFMVFHSADSLMLQSVESPWVHKSYLTYVTYNQKVAPVARLACHIKRGWILMLIIVDHLLRAACSLFFCRPHFVLCDSTL